MKLAFTELPEAGIPHLNGGEGTVFARMYMDGHGKIMVSRLPQGASIGTHTHETSSEVNYVLSGQGAAECGGAEELLAPGDCHYCPKGSSHSIRNTGTEDLVLFTVVPEQ